MVTSLCQLYAVHIFPHRPQAGRSGYSLLPLVVVLEHIASDMAAELQLACPTAAQQLMSHQLFDTERIAEPAVASHADHDNGPSGSKRARERCDGFG